MQGVTQNVFTKFSGDESHNLEKTNPLQGINQNRFTNKVT